MITYQRPPQEAETLQAPATGPTCPHSPKCPSAEAPDRDAAHIVQFHPEQGWNRLCNGVVVFDDTGALLPDGRTRAPHRPEPLHTVVAP